MNLNFVVTLIVFIFGASIGSFLSVIIHRHKNQIKGMITGRSMCPKCRHKLRELDLIPLFSFITNAGKCRYCQKKINRSYFYIELLTGFIFALWSQLIPFYQTASIFPKIQFILTITISTVLIAIFFYDLLYQEIPDSFSLTGMGLSLIYITLFGTPSWISAGIAILIILGFFGGQILISKGKWLGTGDLILGFFMAILLGWDRLILALGFAYIIGAILATSLLLTKKVNRQTNIPFAPFLISGTFISLMFGNSLINWYQTYVIF